MKILNRPMFRMGGPIKEGIMNGIQEPKRQGYNVSGMVFPGDVDRMMPTGVNTANSAKAFEDIFKTNTANIRPFSTLNFEVPNNSFLNNNQMTDKNNDGIINQSDYYYDEGQSRKEKGDRFKEFISPNTKDKFLDVRGYTYENPNYKKPLDAVSDINIEKAKIGLPENISKDMGSKNMPSVKKIIENKGEIENTPLTKKERTNNILEMLGYDKAKKNALYDAMIKAGQRVSRTGLGADNLVSDVIQDTSTSYDKPEKLREAANLMDVQQQLKLDQIDASKTNKNQEDLDFYTKQFGGGEAGRKKALNFLTKQSNSAMEAYLTTKDKTKSGIDGVKGAIEWMINNGDINKDENKGEISKKFKSLSKFLEDPDGFSKTGPGVYQLNGMVVRINADGTTENVQSFGTIDEKTSSWWSK